MPPKVRSFPAQNQLSESYVWDARQIVPTGMEELSRRGENASEERGPSRLLNRPLLDSLPNRPTPASILDVLHFVEPKLKPNRFTAMSHIDALHKTGQIGNMPQSRKLEFQTNSRSGAQPRWSSNHGDTASSPTEIFQQTTKIAAGRQHRG